MNDFTITRDEAGFRVDAPLIGEPALSAEQAATLLVPQQRRVLADLTIRFEGLRYFVPFAEVGELLFVRRAEAHPAVFVFPDGWMPGTSASAPRAHSPSRMRRAASRLPLPDTGAIARKRRASARQGIRAVHQAMRLGPLPARTPDSSAGVGLAIRLLPIEAGPPAPEP